MKIVLNTKEKGWNDFFESSDRRLPAIVERDRWLLRERGSSGGIKGRGDENGRILLGNDCPVRGGRPVANVYDSH